MQLTFKKTLFFHYLINLKAMQFSFTRFNHLFIKQYKENKKAYLLGLVAIPVLIGVISLILAYSGELSENNQNSVLAFGLIIIGGIFCSTLLSDYAPKPRAIRSLILPTTNLEKLLVAVIYGLIIFPIVYLLTVYPVILLVNYIDFEIFGNLYLTNPIKVKGTTSSALKVAPKAIIAVGVPEKYK